MLFEKRMVNLTNPPEWLISAMGEPTYTGEPVTVERSLTVPAVLAAFTILCEDTASLPLILYRRLPRGKQRAIDHPYYALLHDAPNPEMTSYVFREILMGHLLGWGNFYGQLIWDTRGVVREIWPLNPASMEIARKDGERIYLYRNNQGRQIAFTQEQILHVPAFGFDGLRGYSRISLARNAIGLAMATEKYGSRVFQNDARPSVLLKHPAKLGEEAAKALRESWTQTYGGAGNAAKVAVLEEGLDIATIGFPAKDAQFIETQKWTIQQIGRVFGRIPPHMLGDVERSTSWGTGIEQQAIGYVTHTLRPWTVRIDQQLNKDILLEEERGAYFFEHLFDALLRTDIVSRMQAYATAITNGIYTRNEVRERENLLPYEGGDEPLHPLNLSSSMIPADDGDTASDADSPVKPKRDYMPLLLDASRRIAKRDENELNGAIKRYEGKPEKWVSWLEQFYKRDFPQFIEATLTPYFDSGILDREATLTEIQTMCGGRGADVLSENHELLSVENIMPLLQEADHA
jgi:HK97 family phage portal protein